MMKRTFTLMLTLPILLISCSKSDDSRDEERNTGPEENNQVHNCLVLQSDRAGFKPHINEYDDKKRLIKHTYSDFESTLSYSGNTITIINTHQGRPHYKKTVTINEHGLATNVRTDNPDLTWNNEAYEYEGKQVVRKSYNSSWSPNLSVTRYLWEDGNMIEEHAPQGRITRYTFDKKKLFQPGEHLGRADLELGYTVVRNKNRMLTVTDYLGITVTHGFVEDDQGKITHESYTYSTGSNWTEKITYKCP